MNRERDHLLEQALKHQLARRPHAAVVTQACVDAETLGAWEDGGLDAAADGGRRVAYLDLRRCQALAGAVAAAIPVTWCLSGKAMQPGLVSIARQWWLAPFAAAAAAVTIWLVVPAEPPIAGAAGAPRSGRGNGRARPPAQESELRGLRQCAASSRS